MGMMKVGAMTGYRMASSRISHVLLAYISMLSIDTVI